MPKVVITYKDKCYETEVATGLNVLIGAWNVGLDEMGFGDCGGNLVCASCHVRVKSGTFPEMKLDEIWWNQTITQQAFIGKDKALYFAGNDIDILALQGAWVVYFNERMFEDLSLTRPYDLVKD